MDSMSPLKSKILVHDFIDPETYGVDFPKSFATLDLHILAVENSKLRRRVEWEKMISSVEGLWIKKIWYGEGGSAILELELE